MIKKQENGSWLVDIQPGGRGNKRYRKTFKTKSEALAFDRKLQAKLIDDPLFVLPKRDNRRLSEILGMWNHSIAPTIVTGKQVHQRLMAATLAMGDPVLSGSLGSAFAEYRVNRLANGINQATLNKELLAFKSVFTQLEKIGKWSGQNPFGALRIVKTQQPKMSYLTVEQINRLMQSLSESSSDAYIVALICLSTGCRWREAQHLTLSDIRPGLITFGKTKSKKARSVPISEALYKTLFDILSQRRLTDCYTSFSRVLRETGIDLPEGQRTHVLRHTFASYFMMSRGNILTLQKVLGHSSLEMTMRYAHLSPDYLQEVLEKNPALTIGCQNDKTALTTEIPSQ